MSKKENSSNDTKVNCNILQNKLKNLKEYDSRYGTSILQSLSKNITSVDDVLMKQLGTVDMIGCGNNKFLSNEAESVTNIYTDLLTKIANSQSGCGFEDGQPVDKEINKFKKDFLTIVGKDAKRGRKRGPSKSKASKKKKTSPSSMYKGVVGEGISISMDAKKRSKKGSKKGSKKSGSKRRSKRAPRGVKHNIIF